MSTEIKALSKGFVTTPEDKPGFETYKLSCLMRIADATEAMAANYERMKNDKEYYERRFKEEKAAKEKAQASNASLRGVITRMKNKEKRAALQEPAPAGS